MRVCDDAPNNSILFCSSCDVFGFQQPHKSTSQVRNRNSTLKKEDQSERFFVSNQQRSKKKNAKRFNQSIDCRTTSNEISQSVIDYTVCPFLSLSWQTRTQPPATAPLHPKRKPKPIRSNKHPTCPTRRQLKGSFPIHWGAPKRTLMRKTMKK